MYIKTRINNFPCRGYHPGADTVRFELEGAAPEGLGETVTLCADDGFEMVVQTVADWLRWEVQGTTLVLSSLPAPEPMPEPETIAPTMTTEEATLDMLADIDYRLGLIELGGQEV